MLSVYKLSVMCYPNLSQCCEIHTFESSITITILYTVFCIYMWGHCGLIKFTCMITFEATCLKTRSILKPNHGRTTICYKWGLTSVHTWYYCACLYLNLIRHCSFNPGQLFSLRVKKMNQLLPGCNLQECYFLSFDL